MARIPMVTRTISSTEFEVMCLDVTTAEVKTLTFTLTGEHDNNDKTLKALKKDFETDTLKLVHVETHNISTRLYGMTESKFIEYADILPDR